VPADDDDDLDPGQIIGVTVGTVVGVVLFIALLFCAAMAWLASTRRRPAAEDALLVVERADQSAIGNDRAEVVWRY